MKRYRVAIAERPVGADRRWSYTPTWHSRWFLTERGVNRHYEEIKLTLDADQHAFVEEK